MDDPDNPLKNGPDNSAKKCRYCGNKKKPNVKWPTEEYCSGKCMQKDGLKPVSVDEQSKGPQKIRKATLEDYQAHPKDYRRRYEPEKINWGEPLTSRQLKQAGFRANREPIPGDWDYIEQEVADGR